MEDSRIVELYWARSEDAIAETEKKYGAYCYYIARNILNSAPDSEECVNDTYLHAWDAMPPHRPEALSAFLGRIPRNLALSRFRHNTAKKRASNADIVFEEAKLFLADPATRAPLEETLALKDAINSFVASLSKDARIIFVRRYWYFSSVRDIARDHRIPEGTVKSILFRTRKQFKEFLLKEGISI